MDAVVPPLSALDYLFIVAGFFFFFSVHSLCMKALAPSDRLTVVPKVGMLPTVVSRSLDALENFWVILIYTNPDDYAHSLIGLTNVTQSAKWLAVTVEYPTLSLSVLLALLVRFTPVLDSVLDDQ